MKKVCLAILVTLFLWPLGSSYAETWFTFDTAQSLNAASPVNIGKTVLDAPAGKHGFTKVNGKDFIFEDGTQAKFWGTNLCFDACFPTQQQAVMIADRIAFFGFNSVRFHHIDTFFEPRGIFKDVDSVFTDPQKKRTGFLSEQQLQKLDYLIYQLKLRGIYIDFNLLVGRGFTEADGVVSAAQLKGAAKPVSMFDSRMIELQKQYAEVLLQHYNPYTGLKYCDDPAIALIEITNENYLLNFWKQDGLNYPVPGQQTPRIPDYYIAELDSLWNSWIQAKYGTPENVAATWGVTDTSYGETVISQDGATWAVELWNGAACQKSIVNGATKLSVSAITGTGWHVEYLTHGLNLSKNKAYAIKFKGSASKSIPIELFAQQNYAPGASLGLSKDLTLTTTPQDVEVLFTPTMDCPNATLGLVLGYTIGVITLENLQVSEVSGLVSITQNGSIHEFKYLRPYYSLLGLYPVKEQADIRDFYINLEKNYFNEMRNFIRNSCYANVPITGMGGAFMADDMTAQSDCDFLDTHVYWDHPEGSDSSFTIHNRSMLADANLGIIGSINKLAPASKPYTITEWNHCYPNQRAYETPVLMASEAVKNGWDGLYQFSFNHAYVPDPNIHEDFFDTSENPQKLILTAISSLVYLKNSNINDITSQVQNSVYTLNSPAVRGVSGSILNKTYSFNLLTVTPNNNGAVFMFSAENKPLEESNKVILAAVSDVKKTNSGWNANGTFNWGTLPMQLQSIGVQVAVNTSENIEVYALDNTGARSAAVSTSRSGNTVAFNTNGINTPWFEITINQQNPIIIQIPGTLNATPAESMDSTGNEGSTFTPSAKTYTLKNTGDLVLNWTASKSANWVSLSSSSGSLNPGLSTTISVTINANASTLAPGSYADTISLINTSNGLGNTSAMVSLTVKDVLEAPIGLIASDGTSTDVVELLWNSVSGATYYNLYRSASESGTKTLLGSTGSTSYQDSTAVVGTTYYYWVKAANDSTESTYSAWNIGYKKVIISTVPAVTTLSVYSVTSSSVRLTWKTPGTAGAIAGYDVRYSKSSITESNWASATQVTGEPSPGAPGTTVFFNIKGLSASTTYYFAVKTYDAVKKTSGLSNVASGKTQNSTRKYVMNAQTSKLFDSVQYAYDDTVTETGDDIKCQNVVLEESIAFNDNKTVLLEGGLDSSFTNQSGVTAIEGNLDVKSGEVCFASGEIHLTNTVGETIIN